MTTQNKIIYPLTDDIIDSTYTVNDLYTASIEEGFHNVHIHVVTSERDVNKLPCAGTIMKYSSNDLREANTWSRAEADTFQLRVGPNYDKFKAKASAAPDSEFYDVVGIDFFQSPKRIDNIATKVRFPEAWVAPFVTPSHAKNNDSSSSSVKDRNLLLNKYIPPFYILNVQIPSNFSTPFFSFSEVTDGAGWSLVIFFRLKQAINQLLLNTPSLYDTSVAPALRLLALYCMETETPSSTTTTATAAPTTSGRDGDDGDCGDTNTSNNKPTTTTTNYTKDGRLKVICRINNIEQFGLPAFITAYNAKPTLIRYTGTLNRGSLYLHNETDDDGDIGKQKYNKNGGESSSSGSDNVPSSSSGSSRSNNIVFYYSSEPPRPPPTTTAPSSSSSSSPQKPSFTTTTVPTTLLSYLEMDINVHRFGSLPKKGLETLFSRFPKMSLSVGLCLESRNDDEMPEMLIGCFNLNQPTTDGCPWPIVTTVVGNTT